MIQLSNINPDFNDLVTQLTTALSGKSAWTDRITSSTGQTIIEMIAAIGAYSQYSIESQFQEEWPESAKNASSLYAASNFLGVRLRRKGPALIKVMMSAPSNMTISVNSIFNGAGTYWFNRDPLVLTTTPSEVTLYQGKIENISFYGLGTDFQALISTEKDFLVSDTDVFLTINSVSVPAIQQGLWTKQGVPGAQHLTLPNGAMMLLFGNALYGSKPGVNDLCEVVYAVTLGEDGDNIPTIGKTFSLESNAAVSGLGTTQAAGGGNENSPTVYKNITPALFGAFNSSVTGSQYKRLPLQYPGVIDAELFAQREINPRALTWMNVIKVCLLTTTVWDNTAWNNFETWFLDQTMYSTRVFREDPIPSDVTVTATVSCTNLANLAQAKADAEAAIDALFAPRQGIIGLDIYRSDIINTILDSNSNIEYLVLEEPVNDIILSSFNVGYPTFTVLPSGGALAIGQYDYAISAVNSLGGESAPAFWITAFVTVVNSRVSLSWKHIPNATHYKVWGRTTPTAMGLIATLDLNALYTLMSLPIPDDIPYIDTGSIVPTGTVPVQSTVSTYYPRLIAKDITVGYSNRDKLS
jgi:hypothetical protein